MSWRAPDTGFAGPCLPRGAAAVAQELRMQVGKQGWGVCQTPPESGEKWEGAAACLGATGTPKDARQEGGGSKQHGHLLMPGSGRESLRRGEKMSIPAVLARAKPCAKPRFSPAFEEPLWQEHGILAAGGTGPSGRGARGPRPQGTIQPGGFDRPKRSRRAGCRWGRSQSIEIQPGTAAGAPGRSLGFPGLGCTRDFPTCSGFNLRLSFSKGWQVFQLAVGLGRVWWLNQERAACSW